MKKEKVPKKKDGWVGVERREEEEGTVKKNEEQRRWKKEKKRQGRREGGGGGGGVSIVPALDLTFGERGLFFGFDANPFQVALSVFKLVLHDDQEGVVCCVLVGG